MTNHVHLKTREDMLAFLEKIATTIVHQGVLVEKGAVAVQVVQAAHKILEGQELSDLNKQVLEIERLVKRGRDGIDLADLELEVGSDE